MLYRGVGAGGGGGYFDSKIKRSAKSYGIYIFYYYLKVSVANEDTLRSLF